MGEICKVCRKEWIPKKDKNLCCENCGYSIIDCVFNPHKIKKWRKEFNER